MNRERFNPPLPGDALCWHNGVVHLVIGTPERWESCGARPALYVVPTLCVSPGTNQSMIPWVFPNLQTYIYVNDDGTIESAFWVFRGPDSQVEREP